MMTDKQKDSVVVPTNPTNDMLSAGVAAMFVDVKFSDAAPIVRRGYKAMLAASPSHPQEKDAGRLSEPTDEMVSVCLQTFRHELHKHMDLKHPSCSPGHDSMRIALRTMLAASPVAPIDRAIKEGEGR